MTAVTESILSALDAEQLAEQYALWDQLREAAISEADRHEIDDVFARHLP